ncbi:MAG: C69 family dipeptidase [Coriobacteriales bacterium]|nr:C69 family dipeptidase [Coriobacteriales bacterium]
MNKKQLQKRFVKASLKLVVIVATVFALVFGNTLYAFACTQIYLGSETTVDGTIIWGRTEDISANYLKLYTVHPAETHTAGDLLVYSDGFTYPYPAQTVRYTLVKDSIYNEGITPEPYAEAGVNENNVALSATVTLSRANDAVTGIDAAVRTSSGGIAETEIASIVLMQATSARHGTEILAAVYDTYGAAGREGTTIGDPNEVWFMHSLSGHQYVAIKLPSDKIGFSPNITMLGEIDITDSENVIASPGIISTAIAAGTFVPGPNDNPAASDAVDGHTTIMVAQSYAQGGTSLSGRMYLGYYFLLGSQAALDLAAEVQAKTDANAPVYYEYLITPPTGKKYSLYEAMQFQAYHGNAEDATDGAYVAPVAGNGSAIGNQGTVEAHLFVTSPGMPDSLATVEWLALGPAEFSLYIPGYGSLITETNEHYGDAYDSDRNNRDFDNAYWVQREIYALTNANRDILEPFVAPLVKDYQLSLISQQEAVDEKMLVLYNSGASPEELQATATMLNKALGAQTFAFTFSLLTDIRAILAGDQTDLSAATRALADPVYAPLLTADVVAGNVVAGGVYQTPAWLAYAAAAQQLEDVLASPDATPAEIAAALTALENARTALKADDTSSGFTGVNGNEYTKSSGTPLVCAFPRDLSLFNGKVLINNGTTETILVEREDYTVASGSTIITLSSTYLDTLVAGSYTLKVGFGADATVASGFTILSAPVTPPSATTTLPPTGDSSLPLFSLVFSLLLAGFALVFRRTRKLAK